MKLRLSDLRKLVEGTVREQKILSEMNKVSDQDVDYAYEAGKLVDRWGLDPEEIGWQKIVNSYAVGHQANVQKIDMEKMIDAIDKVVKDRTKELDKWLEKRRR